ncbi:hypothetical protein I6N96_02115 [Enterococcus sp. BWM-S5]|uniref:Uncharacterized protein n=1 Tax=Enterococcus larvae TaxID=2794352 RepID=A0ABS4CEK7_9ENTE|nr:hypothetical protein [Enterococcus larvae]MBP1045059.1 hypothetical protein [Enterococcus larvae]
MAMLLILIAIFILAMLGIKKKWKLFFLLLLIGGLCGGLGYYAFYGKPLSKKKEEVSEYFSYFEDHFQFQDQLENYTWKTDYSSTPRLFFDFEAYQKDWILINDALSETTPEETGIGVLRNHIYAHYAAYVTEEFIFDKEQGNDFSKVVNYLDERGYDYQWDAEIHYPKDSEGFDLYIETSISANLRINRLNQEVSLEKELVYYKDKTMESFDFLDYMAYFDYGIHLTGTYFGDSSEIIDDSELNQLINDSLTNDCLTVVLSKKE